MVTTLGITLSTTCKVPSVHLSHMDNFAVLDLVQKHTHTHTYTHIPKVWVSSAARCRSTHDGRWQGERA